MRCRAWLVVGVCACGPSVGGDGDATSTADTSGTSTGQLDGAEAETSPGTTPPVADSTGPAVTTVATTVGADSTGEGSSSTGEPPPKAALSRVLFFYTPHGFYADQAWTGDGGNFALGSMLASLQPWQDDVLIADGISNDSADPKGMPVLDVHSTSSAGLLTGGLLGSGTPGGDENFDPHYAGGPSLDVRLGQLLPPVANTSVHLAVQPEPVSVPLGVSYFGADQPNIPQTNPQLAFGSLFRQAPPGPLLDEVQALIDANAGSVLGLVDVQLAIARAAFAYDLARSQLVSIDHGIPQITWTELGHTYPLHEALVLSSPDDPALVYDAWGDSFGAFIADLAATDAPEGGSLLDSTLVVWVSDLGPNPAGHTRNAVLCVMVDTTGTLATGQVAQVEADQADLAATIAAALGIELGPFGDPALDATPIAALLTP